MYFFNAINLNKYGNLLCRPCCFKKIYGLLWYFKCKLVCWLCQITGIFYLLFSRNFLKVLSPFGHFRLHHSLAFKKVQKCTGNVLLWSFWRCFQVWRLLKMFFMLKVASFGPLKRNKWRICKISKVHKSKQKIAIDFSKTRQHPLWKKQCTCRK